MARILATNGTLTRLMGEKELKQNPLWRAVADGDIPSPGVARKVQEKEVKTAAAAPVTKEVRVPEVDPPAEVAEEQAEEVATTAADTIPAMIAKIKAATTEKEVKALVKDETRTTVLNIAEKRIKAISK